MKPFARRRRPRAAATLLTALTLTFLGACAPTTPPASVSEPSSTVATQSALLTFQGTASLNGAPLAGAQLKAVDAITGQALSLVASGAGNLVASGAGNLVAAGAGNLVASGAGNLVASGAGNVVAAGGSDVTDASGNFSVSVAGLTAGHPVQLVAVGTGGALTALVGGSSSSNYRVTEATTLELTAASTAAANAYLPLLKLFATTPSLISLVLSNAAGSQARLQTYFNTHHEAASSLFSATSQAGTTEARTLQITLTTSGEDTKVQASATTVAQTALETGARIESTGGLATELTTIGIELVLDAEGAPTGEIKIGDKVITLPVNTTSGVTPNKTGTTNPNGTTTVTQDLSGASDGDEIGLFDPVNTGAVFVNDVSASYSTDLHELRISLTQSKGQLDVQQIIARLPVSAVVGTSFGAGSLGNGHVTNPLALVNVSQVPVPLTGIPLVHPTTANLRMIEDLSVTSDVTLPARYGGGTLVGTTASFKGVLNNTGYLPALANVLVGLQDSALLPDARRSSQLRTQKIADVQVFNNGVYWYFVVTYTLNPAFSPKNQGGTTTLTTDANVLQLKTSGGLPNGDVTIVARGLSRSERVLDITAATGSLHFGGEDGVTFP